ADCFQVALHLVGEPLAVRLFVVDDVDVLLLQGLMDEGCDLVTLLAVVRNRTVEGALRRLTRCTRLGTRQRNARSRARHGRETSALVDGIGLLDLLAACGTGYGQDLAVRRERVRHRNIRGSIRGQLRITLPQLDLQI